ncbi:MAG: TetR/AcrR family transcriptional regulator [Pseudomonadota bacterium]
MARKATFNRDDILRRARDLFWRKGYHATSLKDLEQVLELKPGSIYAAFGSKEALFSEALEVYARGSRSDLEAALDAGGSPLDALAQHARSLSALCDQDRPARACMLVKTILEHPDEQSPVRQLAETLMDEAGARFIDGFRRAKAAGELAEDADPIRLGLKFQSDVVGLRAFAQRSDGADVVPALAEDLARSVEALRVA